ncbi:phosphatase PAP2 family protein [Mycolicibacterium brumae]|uniref:PAP2 family protein n=1 Tax=Mycolicibacterium brumae TaxID=85968 RepID=A0A2G5PGN3_9MYCO|nr:phosphatase PAP2 family protein [Mycolicibacterium brumae]MCV7194252.1 phosphatase PAP2 family protein [Mycolicibacterium brumae]PIB77104.1 PAP2 family protein [Mycolicibacterium brumae]RWA19268.1 hypothetical protein MBRU_17065 [Mycolicibacterium brumae DSM 44177]UWW10439.1 phosphatase PAP2 family protein [Mycolicibacterium brumae]
MTRRRLLTAGSLLAAAVLYAVLWLGWTQDWEWLNRADDAALNLFVRVADSRPWWVTGWDVFCIVFSPTALRVLALVLIVRELARRNFSTAWFLVLSVELSGLVTEGAKALGDRPRPVTQMVSAHNTSFPSGHALGLLVIVFALLIVYGRYVPPRWRNTVVWLGIGLVVAIGLGRVVLNVHHPSDVLAGWALGYLYLALCLWLCPPRGARGGPVSSASGTPAAPDTAT